MEVPNVVIRILTQEEIDEFLHPQPPDSPMTYEEFERYLSEALVRHLLHNLRN